eukprot:m.47480 g.47480  ORF g.47480 m.47480 type:complete len:51 (+) comp13228_c0_seq1:1772-1924(+)
MPQNAMYPLHAGVARAKLVAGAAYKPRMVDDASKNGMEVESLPLCAELAV